MEWDVGGVKIDYPLKGGVVTVAGKPLEDMQLFELYSLLRALYNDANRERQKNMETEILRKIRIEGGKGGESL